MSHVLWYIGYSPWSERARFALHVAGVNYKKRVYTPTLSEASLRWAIRRPRGKLTLPVFLPEGAKPLCDSWDIAQWAHQQMPAAGLMLDPDAIREVAALADTLLESGRIRTTRRVLQSDETLAESLPPPVQRLGPLGLKIGRKAARDLIAKYDPEGLDDDQHLERMRHSILELRDRLDGRDTLLDRFSYADIVAAVGLAFVKPVDRWSRLGPLSTAAWTEPELQDLAAPLLQWRDTIYAKYRGTGE